MQLETKYLEMILKQYYTLTCFTNAVLFDKFLIMVIQKLKPLKIITASSRRWLAYSVTNCMQYMMTVLWTRV